MEFICERGDFHKTKAEAMRVVTKEGDMEKVKCLESFLKSLKSPYKVRAEENSFDDSWIKNDPTVPQGWMIKKAGGANMKNFYHHSIFT